MPDPVSHVPSMRMSLRSLFALVALAAVACVALKFANPWWLAATATLALVAFMAAAIMALVDRGPRQAFAIGFATCAAIYGGLLVTSRWLNPGTIGSSAALNQEMDPYNGLLPTTRLLGAAFQQIVEVWSIDPATGKRLSKLPKDPLGEQSQVNLVGFGSAFVEQPRREWFMPIGHLAWMLGLGYLGGLFARGVYGRRVRDERPHNAPPGP